MSEYDTEINSPEDLLAALAGKKCSKGDDMLTHVVRYVPHAMELIRLSPDFKDAAQTAWLKAGGKPAGK